MPKNTAKTTPEEEKEKSGRGFDTPSRKAKPAEKALIAAIIIGVLIFALIASGTLSDIFDYFGDSKGGSGSGEVRNCVASVLGNPPECAPNSGGVCLPTIINGKAPPCASSGCKQITIPNAVYNPYVWCYSVTKDNKCIPCQYGDY